MKKRSFTLIETIVVVAVIGITMPVLFVIIFALMRQQVKIYRLSQIKREGDYLINQMENTIKDNAMTIHSGTPPTDLNIVCKDALSSYSSNSSLYFFDKNNNWFGYLFQTGSDTIASASAFPYEPLTSSKILVSAFTISCVRNSIYSSAIILLNFDVCFDTGAGECTSTRPEETSSIHYQTRIKLRNF